MKNTYNILGVNIDAVNLTLASEIIFHWIEKRSRTYVCFAPVSTIIDCYKNSEYKKIINSSGMTTPDGMPVAYLGRLSGANHVERTYGPDLMLRICDLSQERGVTHYFYGGDEYSLRRLINVLRARFPRLKIAGSFSPSYRKVGEIEPEEVIKEINDAEPSILWVGLGSPKQDYWMSLHRNKLNVPVMLGVGAAFDFISGTKPQAPTWMRSSGLEWLFRLIKEPKRLWKRYLLGNTLFLWLITIDSVKCFFKKN